jgi:3',5'-cyclic AMP phosphodiesterase CpdA
VTVQRFIVSWACNATSHHPGFLAALKKFPGRLLVVKGQYKNPTRRNEDVEEDWYDPAIVPYLVSERMQLCPNLGLYADVPIQPTAARPLSSFEVFLGQNSAIFGHPKRALETIASGTRTPRLLVTTGACTVAQYSDSKAGKKGQAHHVLGALVVEIEADGTYHLRHVSAGPKGDFVDLDTHYTPDGIYRARRALTLTFGDVHDYWEDPSVLASCREQVALLRPQALCVHDVLDFHHRNHHDRGLRSAFKKRQLLVRDELERATRKLSTFADWGDHDVIVIDSNHDQAFDKWLDEWRGDPQNHAYWCQVWSRLYDAHARTGQFPAAFAQEAKHFGVHPRVRFLGRDEPYVIKGVAHQFHGHVGLNGARGSSLTYAKLGCKTSTCHTHTPRIIDGNFTGGLGPAVLDHGYNGLPNSWLHANIHLDFRGRRQLIITVKGRFRA